MDKPDPPKLRLAFGAKAATAPKAARQDVSQAFSAQPRGEDAPVAPAPASPVVPAGVTAPQTSPPRANEHVLPPLVTPSSDKVPVLHSDAAPAITAAAPLAAASPPAPMLVPAPPDALEPTLLPLLLRPRTPASAPPLSTLPLLSAPRVQRSRMLCGRTTPTTRSLTGSGNTSRRGTDTLSTSLLAHPRHRQPRPPRARRCRHRRSLRLRLTS